LQLSSLLESNERLQNIIFITNKSKALYLREEINLQNNTITALIALSDKYKQTFFCSEG